MAKLVAFLLFADYRFVVSGVVYNFFKLFGVFFFVQTLLMTFLVGERGRTMYRSRMYMIYTGWCVCVNTTDKVHEEREKGKRVEKRKERKKECQRRIFFFLAFFLIFPIFLFVFFLEKSSKFDRWKKLTNLRV